MQCECVDKEKIRSIIAGHYGVDLKDVKFGIGGGLCAVAESSVGRDAVTGSTTAINAIAASSHKRTVNTGAINASFARLTTVPCFVISYAHDSNGWQCAIKTLYTSGTSTKILTDTNSSTLAKSVNLFTTSSGIYAYANAGDMPSGNITITYVPCKW